MSDELVDLSLAPWSSEEGKRAFFRKLRRHNPEYTQAIVSALKSFTHSTLVMWATKILSKNRTTSLT